MKKKYIFIFAGFLLALNVFAWKEVFSLTENNYLKVDFLDVGQGDSIFVETPQKHQILIDGGPDSTVLQNLSGKEFKKTSNDTAVVSRLVFGKDSFLFTGDISSAAEKKLIARSDRAISSDVLKVAHNGSKYSTSDMFLENVKPKIAVISVGAKNTYGHPTPEVLQRLANYDIKVLRTDQSGDINMISDGNNIYLK